MDWRSAQEWLGNLAAAPNIANAEQAADAIIYRFLNQLGYGGVAEAWHHVRKLPGPHARAFSGKVDAGLP
jgi:hypothetical protein